MDSIIKNLLSVNPFNNLEVFSFERFFLSETLFFYLLTKLPKIKYIGKVDEWLLEKEAISRIRDFLKSNNVDVSID